MFEPECGVPDPHDVAAEPEQIATAPHGIDAPEAKPSRTGPRASLQVGGGNAVEGLGKWASIRNTFLRSFPGGGLVVVSSDAKIKDTAAASSSATGC